MISTPKSRRFVPALAALFVCCLPVPAFSDELQYLPDNPQVVMSIDVSAAAKTRTFKEFVTAIDAFAPPKMKKEREEEMAKFLALVGRFTIGAVMKDKETQEVEVVSATRKVTLADIKDLKKVPAFKKNFEYKEIKHGSVTIYQESYQTERGKDKELGPVQFGDAFFIAEGKYIVNSRKVDALKTIIDRGGKPGMLSPNVQAGLKDVGLGNTIAVVVDMQNMPAHEKEMMVAGMFRGVSTLPDIKANMDKVLFMTVKLNESSKLMASATLTCKDAPSLALVKAIGEKSLAEMKAKAAEEPKLKLPDEFMKYLTGLRTTLNAVKVSSSGTSVTASVEVEPEVGMQAMYGYLFMAASVPPPPPPPPPPPK